jgi:hypothetical protein
VPRVQLQQCRLKLAKTIGEKLCDDPAVFRGVPARVLLWRFGYWMRSGPVGPGDISEEMANGMYLRTRPTNVFKQFISHSWHGPPMIKTLALVAHYNTSAAVLMGLVGSSICSLLYLFGVLPASEKESAGALIGYYSPAFQNVGKWSSWGSLGYSLGYLTTLCLWQLSNSNNRDVLFFDKLCIHQTDAELKARGIWSIDAFLLNTEEIMILWDPSYFERVWCVFEMAIYMALKPDGRIRFVCASFYAIEFIATIMVLLLSMSIIILGLSGAHWTNQVRLPDRLFLAVAILPFAWVVIVPIAFLARRYVRTRDDMLKQVERFSVACSKCSVESDRTYTKEVIEHVYGSEELFEITVRTTLRETLKYQSESFSFPYLMILRVTSPFFMLSVVDVLVSSEDVPAYLKIHWFVGMCIFWFLLIPLLVKSLEMLSGFHLEYRSAGEMVLCVLIGSFVTLLLGCTISLLPLLLGELIAWKIAIAILGAFGCLVAWKKWLCVNIWRLLEAFQGRGNAFCPQETE